jgi:hypothetical protein
MAAEPGEAWNGEGERLPWQRARACSEEENRGSGEEGNPERERQDGRGGFLSPRRAGGRWRSSLRRIDDGGQDTKLLLCLEEDDEEIGVGWVFVGLITAARRRRIRERGEKIWAGLGQERR